MENQTNTHGKLLTIAIPTYNRCKSCEVTLKNIISQITTNNLENEVEILVSDNCSTDETFTMLQNIEKQYGNILKVYKQNENIGSGANCVYLIEACTSEYIQICSDDDIYDKNMIADTIKIIKQEKPQYIFLNCEWPQNKTLTVNIKQDFSGKFSEALKLVNASATHISPSVIKTNLLQNTPYMHSEWVEFEKLVSTKTDDNAYITAKPYVTAGVASGESHWLNNYPTVCKFFSHLLEFSLVTDNDNLLFKHIRNDVINACIGNLKLNVNIEKHSKKKKKLHAFLIASIITNLLLLAILSLKF